jgi:hypothetical protein
MKIFTYKETIIMNTFFLQNIQFIIKSLSSNLMIDKYLLIHYVLIMLIITMFLVFKIFSHWRCNFAKHDFFHSKKNENLKLMKNGTLLSNKVFSKTFITRLVCIYIKTQLWIIFIFMVYKTCIIFNAWINYIYNF